MHYEINGSLGFSPGENLIWRLNDKDDFQQIPRFAGYLLETFLQHNGQPLTREFLLDALWHQNGLTASGNSLNNYISMVRKALANFNLPDVITTIPKYGFCFSVTSVACIPPAELPPEPERLTSPASELPPVSLSPPPPDDAAARTPPAMNPRYAALMPASLLRMAGWATAMLLVLAAVWCYYPSISGEFPQAEPRLQFRLQQCRVSVYDGSEASVASPEQLKQQLDAIITRYGINCHKPQQIYYAPQAAMNISGYNTQRIMLAVCFPGGKKACTNYLIRKDSHG